MRILVQRSRRPRRWAGVAVFAALLLASLWVPRHEVASNDTAVIASGSDSFEERLEPPGAVRPGLLGRALDGDAAPAPNSPGIAASAPGQSAQWTGLAPSTSASTPGARPTR